LDELEQTCPSFERDALFAEQELCAAVQHEIALQLGAAVLRDAPRARSSQPHSREAAQSKVALHDEAVDVSGHELGLEL
jgi:hypothetical protein